MLGLGNAKRRFIKRYDHKKNNSQKTVIEIINNCLCSDWPGGVTAVVMTGAGVYGEFGVEAAGGVTEKLWNQQHPLLQSLYSTISYSIMIHK